MTHYIRHSIISLEVAFSKIHENWDSADAKAEINGHMVGVTSTRLKTFGRDARAGAKLACCSCGLEATHFAIESFARGQIKSPHINLYGIKGGEEVLFTHDHTLARSLGGSPHDLANTTTMCSPCNTFKSKDEKIKSDALKKLAKSVDVV